MLEVALRFMSLVLEINSVGVLLNSHPSADTGIFTAHVSQRETHHFGSALTYVSRSLLSVVVPAGVLLCEFLVFVCYDTPPLIRFDSGTRLVLYGNRVFLIWACGSR